MIGQTVAHYRVMEKLGEGGMGVVYKALDTHLDRFVAVKVLPPGKVADANRRRRFVQEAKSASSLNHPGIVTVHDIAEEDGAAYLVMEFIAGKTLDHLIARGGMALKEVLRVGIQVADAVAAAHAAGIVHRDLKPANIMLADNGQVKVLDFGLAKLTERISDDAMTTATVGAAEAPRTEEGTLVGTVAYMSPEQAEGNPVDARSDIFSFGAVLYEMATGRRAFPGDSRMSTLAAILREDPKPASQVSAHTPRDLEKIISRCLRKDPERRFQHMSDLKVALQELKEESESGTLAAPEPTLRRARRVHPWILLAAALVVAGAASLWMLLRSAGEVAEVSIVPLTAFVGSETSPCFSPDGNQVAFAWNGEDQKNADIYVKLIGAGAPLRLTTDPRPDNSPAWSPDGRWIAFLRLQEPLTAVLLVPALGGPERTVGEVRILHGEMDRSLAWSPDGKWLAVSHAIDEGASEAIHLLSIETGERRKLTSPLAHIMGDYAPAFSPSGDALAFSRSALATVSDLWLLPLTANLEPRGEPVRLTHEKGWVATPAWTADGREIVYPAGPWGNTILRRVPAGGGNPQPVAFAGRNVDDPAIARQGRRMVYVARTDNINIWRVAVGPGGRAASAPAKFIASTRLEQTPDFSPDGQKIAFASCRSGSWQIWVADADGANAAPLTNLYEPFARYPRWSPDGRRIVFDVRAEGQAEIYVMNTRGGRPQRLTADSATDIMPAWSRDGRWIYFSSNRSGATEVWRMPSGGGAAVQVTRGGGLMPIESLDGQDVYFVKSQDFHFLGVGSPLLKMPAGGGQETKVTKLPVGQFAVSKDGLYFISGRSIYFQRAGAAEATLVANLPADPHVGFAVSPDGRSILYTQVDEWGGDIMLVENFR